MRIGNLLNSLSGLARLSDLSSPAPRRQSRRQKERNRRSMAKRHALLESLEDRKLLAAYVVNTIIDEDDGIAIGNVSLRDAINEANVNPGPDEITFDSGVLGTVILNPAYGSLLIEDAITITGPGSGDLEIQAATTAGVDEFRVIEIAYDTGDVTLEGLTISGGHVPGEEGGGILHASDSALTIRNSVITGNTANTGGGIFSRYEGSVELHSSQVHTNTAEYGYGGGVGAQDGKITLTMGSSVYSNTAYQGGGGIFSYGGTVELTDSSVQDNVVTYSGYGGGIGSGSGDVTITGSQVTGNVTAGGGGGIYSEAGVVTVTSSTISNNTAAYSGGGIAAETGSVNVTDSNISANDVSTYGDGGGIFSNTADITLTGSTLSFNTSVEDGGAIAGTSGVLIVRDSLLWGNIANIDGGAFAWADGAIAIVNSTVHQNNAFNRGGGIMTDNADILLTSTTMTDNGASDVGGGIAIEVDENDGTLTIENSIVAQNTSGLPGLDAVPDFVAPFEDPGATPPVVNLSVRNSLIGNNLGTTLAETTFAGLFHLPDPTTGNLIGGPATPANPQLDPLLPDNGGPTDSRDYNQTFTNQNPSVDGGDNALAMDPGPDGKRGGGDDVPLNYDQRQFPFGRFASGRILGDIIDMGAIETQGQPSLLVDTADDIVNGDYSPGDLSLREAIQFANGNAGEDVIEFDASLTGAITLDPALGQLEITDETQILGPGADVLTVQRDTSSATDHRIFNINANSGSVVIEGLTITGGSLTAASADGAGVHSEATNLTLRSTKITGNTTSGSGGSAGGGLYAEYGSVTIESSEISENDARFGAGIAVNNVKVTIVNSTISGNSAGDTGGGLYLLSNETSIYSSTIADNHAVNQAGGIAFPSTDNGETMDVYNSIISGNMAPTNPDLMETGDSINTYITYSFIGNNTDTGIEASDQSGSDPARTSDQNFVGTSAQPLDPGLGDLADNGGPTRTHALSSDSLALDAGDDGSAMGLMDQRGAVRIVDTPVVGDDDLTTIDMGAFELAPLAEITWNDPAPITYNEPLTASQLNATTGALGTLVYTPGLGTILDAGDQTLMVELMPDDPLAYRPTVFEVTLTVNQAVATLDWDDPADIEFGTPLSGTQLNATATFDGAPISGTFVYNPAAGTVLPSVGVDQPLSVTFTPDDTVNFSSAAATVFIDVTAANPNINWNNPSDITFGTPLSATQLNAVVTDNGGNDITADGTLTYNPAIGTVLNVGDSQSLMVTFEPDTAVLGNNYNTVSETVSINVLAATPVIQWDALDDITFGQPLTADHLDAVAMDVDGGDMSSQGTFVYELGGNAVNVGTVLDAGENQSITVTFTPNAPADANYGEATASQTITVSQASSMLEWENPEAIEYGTMLGSGQLDATAAVAGTFTYTLGDSSTADDAVLPVGDGQTLNVSFVPDDANYLSESTSVTIDVSPATPTLDVIDPADITFGDLLDELDFDPIADGVLGETDLAGTFTFSPSLDNPLPAGTQDITITFEPDSDNYATTSATVTVEVAKASPGLMWDAPDSIVFGTLLSDLQLNADADVEGTFTYDPPIDTLLQAGAGQVLTVDFVATGEGAGNYEDESLSVTIDVEKADPAIAWDMPLDIAFGDQITSDQLNAEAKGVNGEDLAGTYQYTPTFGTKPNAGDGQILSVDFSPSLPADKANYNDVTATVTINVVQAEPVVTWFNPQPIDFGTELSALQLNAVADVPGTYAYTPDVGTALEAGQDVPLSVTFTPNDAVNYMTVTQTVSIDVNPLESTVTWNNPADITYGTPLTDTQLNATSDLDGTFTYNPVADTVLGAGQNQTLSVTFAPTDTNYASTTASVEINVNKATPDVNWDTPDAIDYGTVLGEDHLDATAFFNGSEVVGAFTYDPGANAILDAGTQTLSVTFTPEDIDNFNSATGTVNLTVNPVTPLIDWDSPSALNFGDALGEGRLDAQAIGINASNITDAGTFVYTVGGETVDANTQLDAGSDQVIEVVFTPDSSNYTSASGSVTIDVAKGTPSLTWSDPDPIVFGDLLGDAQLNAMVGGDLDGTLTYTPAAGTSLGAGDDQTLSVVFTPTDEANYDTASLTVTIDVQKANPEIAWDTPDPLVFGTPLGEESLDASANVDGSFSYNYEPTEILQAGTGQELTVSFTPTDTDNYNTLSQTVLIDILKADPVITWESPDSIVFGDALTSTELDATANVEGTFVYSPEAGSQPGAGEQQLSATFTPTDTGNYNTVNASTTITVDKATPTVSWSDPSSIEEGTLLSDTQLNATASVDGSFVYSPPAGTALTAGEDQTLTVSFTPTDSDNYASVEASVSITVTASGRINPTITFDTTSPIGFGTPLSADIISASAGVEGSFVYNPELGTVLNAGDGQVINVTFTPANTETHNTVSSSVSIDVSKATPVLSWNTPDSIVVGTALGDGQLNPTANVDGTFEFTPASGTILELGANQQLSAVFTPTDSVNYESGTVTTSIDVVSELADKDFGDAPSNYPVLSADNGASHIVGTLRLGTQVTPELDGKPSANADADNDDGIMFLSDLVRVTDGGSTASIGVNVTESALLDAWIDFNADGDWNDDGEQIGTNLAVSAGTTNILSYSVPATASLGDTFARFRLSTTGSLSPTGAASDGEVEDYLVTVLDGDTNPDANVQVIEPVARIQSTGDEVVVKGENKELLRVKKANVDRLKVTASDGDETVTLDFTEGDAIPQGGLDLDGGAGTNTLVVTGAEVIPNEGDAAGELINGRAIIDFASSLINVTNFRNIDLDNTENPTPTTLKITANAIGELSPADKIVTIRGGVQDDVEFASDTANAWRLGLPTTVNGTLLRRVVNLAENAGSELVELDLPARWKNIIRPADVNNDGKVTAVDALDVINEINNRRFSTDGVLQQDASPAANDPTTEDLGRYFDTDGNDRVTALDALNVINRLLFQTSGNNGDGELVVVAIAPDYLAETQPSSQASNEVQTDEPEEFKSISPKLTSASASDMNVVASITSGNTSVVASEQSSDEDAFGDDDFVESLGLASERLLG